MNIRLLILITLLISVIGLGCTIHTGSNSIEIIKINENYEITDLSDVIKNPQDYVGKKIQVIGYSRSQMAGCIASRMICDGVPYISDKNTDAPYEILRIKTEDYEKLEDEREDNIQKCQSRDDCFGFKDNEKYKIKGTIKKHDQSKWWSYRKYYLLVDSFKELGKLY